MELSDMKALVRTPDFGRLSCLQKLILHECESLEEIHQSLGNHSSLVHVSVSGCYKLKSFPTIVRMKKLKILAIVRCKALIEFLKIEANMDNLVQLSLGYVGIEILPWTIKEYCRNLTWLSLDHCSKLKSIDFNFHALKGLKHFILTCSKGSEKLLKGLFHKNLDGLGLRKLELSWCKLKDGDIPNEIGELSNLRELHLWGNNFTRLDFSLLRLTRLKLLRLSGCENLVELPELPSSLAIIEANYCNSLEVIKDDAHRRCKWLCQVSVRQGGKNISGVERLLETMLQGNAVESGCLTLHVEGLEILRGFEPSLVEGRRCKLQLPDNWWNDFSGFLICVASPDQDNYQTVSMKHWKKSVGGLMEILGDSQDDDDDDVKGGSHGDINTISSDDDDDDDDDDDECLEEKETVETWVGYIPFSLLRDTSWWDPTSTAVEVEFEVDLDYNVTHFIKCGLKPVPKRRVAVESSSSSGQKQTTPATLSSSHDYKYKCKLDILHDTKSVVNFIL